MLNLCHSRLTSLFGLKDVARTLGVPVTEMDLSNNDLDAFEHFGTHPELRCLDVERNRITSFLGMTKQRSLVELRVAGNPIALHGYYRIMALLTIGFSLKVIDNRPVESAERDLARKLGPSAALAVSYGWLLDPVARTTAEYDAIITELRHARKVRLESTNPSMQVRTVPMALAEKQATSWGSCEDGMPPTSSNELRSDSISVTAETVMLQNKALLHFSKRVVQLERYAAELHQALIRTTEESKDARFAQGQMDSGVSQSHDGHSCLSDDELRCASTIQFDQGIVVFGPSASSGTACSLTFSRDGLLVQRFFNRVCLADILFADVVASEVDATMRRIVVNTRQGATLDLCMEPGAERSASTYSAVWKLLLLRCPPGSIVERAPTEEQKPAVPIEPVTVSATEEQNCRARVETPSPNPVISPASAMESMPNAAPRDEDEIANVAERAEMSLNTSMEEPPMPLASQVAPVVAAPVAPIVAAEVTAIVPRENRARRSSSSDSSDSSSIDIPTHRGKKVQPPTEEPPASKIKAPDRRPNLTTGTMKPPSDAQRSSSSSSREVVAATRSTAMASAAKPDDAPLCAPAPKRSAWRDREIRELMIDSSDSDG